MVFCLDQSEERREWKENLRRTRSQSDMVHTVPKPALEKRPKDKDWLEWNKSYNMENIYT